MRAECTRMLITGGSGSLGRVPAAIGLRAAVSLARRRADVAPGRTDAGRMVHDVAVGTATELLDICSDIPITVGLLAENIADQYGLRPLLRVGARAEDPADPAYVVGRASEQAGVS